jgi:ABC-2 type transport system ATP-binding protein
MEPEPIIRITNLEKRYKGAYEPALDDISFDIRDGRIFGLLGPNGAGKTTTISILCGLIPKTSGKITIIKKNPEKDLDEIKRSIGIVPQEIALYPSLTARENLSFIGSMYGLSGAALRQRIEDCLVMMGLENKAGRMIRTYSGGMKRRINLIAGILHKPKILFLDEPTVGVDVQSRNLILEHIRQMNHDGTTIIYTSHYLEEAEQLCDDIAIIDNGKILLEGTLTDLLNSKPEFNDLESIFLHLTGRRLRDN